MSTAQASQGPCKDLPRAKVGRDWKTYLFWLVPVFAAALAGWFIYSDFVNKGPELHIHFADATGLQGGKSPVQYRGATVGQVEDIKLMPDQHQVDVKVSLRKSASGLAREGSRFWIVKAQVGLAQVSGLNTIVSGDYITVDPGKGKPQMEFEGLGEAPVDTRPKVLRLVLLAERLGSVKPRAPVYYRGVQVGEVAGCELGPHAQTVRILVDVQDRYAPLVRVNSVFWNAGGVNVNVGLSGADISAQSFKTLITGGIDFATPDTSQKAAFPGTSFRLYDRPQDAWLAWAPDIEIGHDVAKTDPTGGPSARGDQ